MKKTGFWPSFWIMVTYYGPIWLSLYFVGILLRWEFNLQVLVAFLIPLVVTIILNAAVRVTIKRKRPDLTKALYMPRYHVTSFPSAHTAGAFAMAGSLVAIHLYLAGVSWKIIPMLIIVIGLATLIGWSRVVIGVHYKLDVFAGGLLGVLIGYFGAVLMLGL